MLRIHTRLTSLAWNKIAVSSTKPAKELSLPQKLVINLEVIVEKLYALPKGR